LLLLLLAKGQFDCWSLLRLDVHTISWLLSHGQMKNKKQDSALFDNTAFPQGASSKSSSSSNKVRENQCILY
jgi:hypothetical protein